MEADFGGWATKAGLRCSDGRIITSGAFAHQDGQRVPLVWQHRRDSPENIVGYAVLEHRDEGVYAHGYFNDTEYGQHMRALVRHGDLNSLSIHANQLQERGNEVLHGEIREVSLVVAGANPGAFIDQVNLAHGSDGAMDEAIIYTGLNLSHEEEDKQEGTEDVEQAEEEGKTLSEILHTMNDEQREAVAVLLAEALSHSDEEDSEDESDEDDSESPEDDSDEDSEDTNDVVDESDGDEDLNHSQEGISMTRNLFDQDVQSTKPSLSHEQLRTIVADAQKLGSFKESFIQHADDYGIKDIELLFPDAKTLASTPDFIKRRTEWVNTVLSNVAHSPFAKVKSVHADITGPEARAKGYVTGTRKTEEVIKLLRRTTGPTTIYKKQKLDRDDLLDITDFDVVVWLKAEMRLMLEEELARAILIGDGRSSSSDDKVKDPEGSPSGDGIRSIINDDPLYAHPVHVPTNLKASEMIEAVIRARPHYKGSGNPVLFTTTKIVIDMLLEKDKIGRRLYETREALAATLNVSSIVEVEVMEEEPEIVAILVNLRDYTLGTNAGGQTTFFDDFDIDFNQMKYLLETRLSGSLTRPKSAIVIRRNPGTAVVPSSPSFNGETNEITIPTVTGVDYLIDDEVVTGVVEIDATTEVVAQAKDGYYIQPNATSFWTFVYTP